MQELTYKQQRGQTELYAGVSILFKQGNVQLLNLAALLESLASSYNVYGRMRLNFTAFSNVKGSHHQINMCC